MAVVTLRETGRALASNPEMVEFLDGHGVSHEMWPVPPELASMQGKDALAPGDQERVLQAYRERLAAEAAERGYIQADMVVLAPSTPGLDEALAKFDKLHYHDDDEVRYIFAGEGVFGFEPEGAAPFTVRVSAGDYIIVPAKTYHWFTLTESRSIKAIRLFKDTSGWVPHYKHAMG